MTGDAPPIPTGSVAERARVRQPPHVWPAIGGFAATRLLGNVFVRFPYVFAEQISRGLGIDLRTLTTVLGARELGGLAAPQAGRWVDRGHLSRVIVVGGVLAGVSCVVAGTSWFWVFTVAMVIGGAAKISIDLAQNAWIGHHVDLDTRGRVIGVIEMTWAGAFLVGVPALGWLIDRHGWQWAFVATGPLLVAAAVWSGVRLPDDVVDPDAAPLLLDDTPPTTVNPRLKPAVWAFCFLQPMAQMLVFAVNGFWFTDVLKLGGGALGLVVALLGVAELVGTVITVWLTDRAGPLRCGMWGMVAAAVPLAAIVAAGTNVTAAIGLMIVMDIAIEFAFVAVLPMVSELDVDNRGKAVSHVFVLIMVSRAIASALAGVVYDAGGFDATIAASTTACVLGAVALWWCRRGTVVA